eukprot:5291231-Amphidinium_carterae.1
MASWSLFTTSASLRVGPKPRDSQADLCWLHITNFPSPLSHKGVVKYCVDTWALPGTASPRDSQGCHEQRVLLRFEGETTARSSQFS